MPAAITIRHLTLFDSLIVNALNRSTALIV